MTQEHEHHQDPTFYRSPARRGRRAAASSSPTWPRSPVRPTSRTRSRWWTSTRTPQPTAPWWASPRCRAWATSCITSAGTPAPARCARAAAHDHGDRRYLIVPGLRSSRLHVLDTQPDPAAPQVIKTLGPEELGKRAGYSRPHTVHCGPGALYVSCLGGGNAEGPGGVALLDQNTLRGDRPVGGRPRRPVPGLRHLVARHARRGHHLGVGHPVDDRGRRRARAAARPEVRAPAALLGHEHPDQRPDGRPGRAAPDGAGAAPGPRPDQAVRLRRRGHQHRGPVRLDLAVASGRRREVGGAEGHHDPGRAGRRGGPAARPAAVRRGAAAGYRPGSGRGRPEALRLLLGHRRAEAV